MLIEPFEIALRTYSHKIVLIDGNNLYGYLQLKLNDNGIIVNDRYTFSFLYSLKVILKKYNNHLIIIVFKNVPSFNSHSLTDIFKHYENVFISLPQVYKTLYEHCEKEYDDAILMNYYFSLKEFDPLLLSNDNYDDIVDIMNGCFKTSTEIISRNITEYLYNKGNNIRTIQINSKLSPAEIKIVKSIFNREIRNMKPNKHITTFDSVLNKPHKMLNPYAKPFIPQSGSGFYYQKYHKYKYKYLLLKKFIK